MKMKNISHRCDINRSKPRYSKYENCLNMILLICIKQLLSNIWRSIHEHVEQHWGSSIVIEGTSTLFSFFKYKLKQI